MKGNDGLPTDSPSLPPIGVFRADESGRWTYLDDSCCAMTGLVRAEALGRPWLRVVHPEDRRRVSASWAEAVQASLPFRQSFRLVRPDGVARWVIVQSDVDGTSESQQVERAGTVIDLTDQRLIREALVESEARFRELVDAIPHGVQENDLEGTITFSNSAHARMLGYSQEELVGKKIWDLPASEAERETLRDHLAFLVQEQPSPESYFSTVRKKDGSLVDVRVDWAYKRDRSGRLLGFTSVITDLTRRRQVQEALRTSQETLQLILDTIPVRVFWKDRNSVYLGCNRYFAEDAGLSSPSEIVGKNDFELAWRDQAELYRSDDLQVIESGQPKLHYEEPQTGPDGEQKWLRTSKIPLRAADGTIEGVLACYEDVTELRRASDTLKRAEKRYRELFEDAPVMSTITRNEEGVPIVEDCNTRFLRSLGYRRKEVIGRPLADFYAPESRHKMLNGGGYERALKGSFVTQERRLVTKGAQVIETLLRAVPERDAEGQVTGTRAMYMDVTERKAAQEALARSEERYRRLFEDSKDAIFISTPDGSLLDINPAGVELFGFSTREELVGSDFPLQSYRDPQERDRLLGILAREGFVRDYELSLTDRRGNEIIALETATAVRNEAGEVIAYQGILRNVSAQRRLELQVQQTQKMEAIGRLAGGIAHDFNNILTLIKGYAELLGKRLGDESPHLRDLQQIVGAGDRAAALTRQLLAFTRQQVLEPKVVDLNHQVSEIERMLRRMIREDIDLQVNLDPGLGQTRADPTQIDQILINLTVNARDAMPEGGTIRFSTKNVELDGSFVRKNLGARAGSYVALEVVDTGCGMDESTCSRVFEPFFTTKRKGEGSGLGLSTVYGIVKQSGGYITVESRLGRGTKFWIYLPRVDEKLETSEAVSPIATAIGSETILLVEDDPTVRQMATKILEDSGFRVVIGSDVEEALALFERHADDIDVLLTDLVLPGSSGLKLASKIRSLRPETKVLVMSGYPDKSALGGDREVDIPFLAKPFDASGLTQKVREVLNHAFDS